VRARGPQRRASALSGSTSLDELFSGAAGASERRDASAEAMRLENYQCNALGVQRGRRYTSCADVDNGTAVPEHRRDAALSRRRTLGRWRPRRRTSECQCTSSGAAATTTTSYLGDDITDEDAFEALSGRGFGIFVGHADDPEVAGRTTAADFRLDRRRRTGPRVRLRAGDLSSTVWCRRRVRVDRRVRRLDSRCCRAVRRRCARFPRATR
jgi:hypothetical protein